MTSAAAVDPLDLGQRLVAVLETGRRVATYKLATLTALIDFAVEHLPADPVLDWSYRSAAWRPV